VGSVIGKNIDGNGYGNEVKKPRPDEHEDGPKDKRKGKGRSKGKCKGKMPSGRRFNLNAIVKALTLKINSVIEMNNFVASATSPDIACISAPYCKTSQRTKRTSKIDGGHAAMMMDKSSRLLLLPPILYR
jgi:hypothetical protein